jgi:hypothetical protein
MQVDMIIYSILYIMNMSDSIIEMKGSLKKIQLENMMIQKIRKELCDSFVNVQDIKINVDLIRKICCTTIMTISLQQWRTVHQSVPEWP